MTSRFSAHVLLLCLFAGLIAFPPATARACPNCWTSPGNMTRFYDSTYLWRTSVMGSPRVYIVYWGWGGPPAPYGSTNRDPNGARQSYLNLLEGNSSNPARSSSIGGTRWISSVSQYSGNDSWYPFGSPTYPDTTYADTTLNLVNDWGGLAAEVWDDDPSRPPTCGGYLNEGLWAKQTAFGSTIPEGDADIMIIVAMPSGATQCGSGHSYTVDFRDPVDYPGGVPVSVAQIDYGGVANESATAFHEVAESVTDPFQASWYTAECGQQCENGDLCAASQNWAVQVASQAPSRVQSLWSNEASACVHGRASSANLFVVGQDQHLWQQYNYASWGIQQYGYTSWGAPTGVSLAYVKPATVSWGPQRIDNFARATNGSLYHAWTDDGGYTIGWEPIGTPPPLASLTSSVDAASWGFGRLDAFVNIQSGINQYIWHRSYDASVGWRTWQYISPPPGRSLQSGPAASSWGTWPTDLATGPRVDVFEIMSDGNIWQASATDTAGSTFVWSQLVPYGGARALPYCQQGDPDVAAGFDMKSVQYNDYERWDIFVRDCYGNLWDGAVTREYGSSTSTLWGWSLWSPPSGITFINGPSVASLGDGRFIVAAQGSDQNAYLNNWNNGVSNGWTHLFGPLGSAPDLSSW